MRKFWRSAAECLFASVILGWLTFACYRLHFNLATAALLFELVVVLISRVGSFIAAIVTAVAAALCLAHLASPVFSFEVADPFDLIAITAFVITSLVVARLMSRVRRQAELALSSVSFRVVESEEHERKRMAETLHEDIGQRLTLLAIEIEKLMRDCLDLVGVHSRTDGLRKQTLEILTDIKAVAHELHSPRLEYLRLGAVMSSFCKEFGDRKKVKINFKSDGLPDVIPPNVALCLFRVLQEGLLNAVQHSGVSQFNAQLWSVSDEIHLMICDTGAGFSYEAATKTGGLGLNRMRERLKLVKGELSVDSEPKRGTTIHASVPLRSGTDSWAGFAPWKSA